MKEDAHIRDGRVLSQSSQLGITVMETKTKAISTFMVPNKGASVYLFKAVVDFMSGCGCCRAIIRSDGEPAVIRITFCSCHTVCAVHSLSTVVGTRVLWMSCQGQRVCSDAQESISSERQPLLVCCLC